MPDIGEIVPSRRDPTKEAVWDGSVWVERTRTSGPPLAAGGKPVMIDTKTDQDSLETTRAQARKSLDVAMQAGRFTDINRNHATGGLMNLPLVGDIAASFNPAQAEMQSITSQVAPGLRPPGSGSSSDTDVKFYTQGFPNRSFPKATNDALYKRLRDQSTRDNAYASFKDTWFQKKGTLLGADQAFNKYWTGKMLGPGGSRLPQKAPAGGLSHLSDDQLKAELGL